MKWCSSKHPVLAPAFNLPQELHLPPMAAPHGDDVETGEGRHPTAHERILHSNRQCAHISPHTLDLTLELMRRL